MDELRTQITTYRVLDVQWHNTGSYTKEQGRALDNAVLNVGLFWTKAQAAILRALPTFVGEALCELLIFIVDLVKNTFKMN